MKQVSVLLLALALSTKIIGAAPKYDFWLTINGKVEHNNQVLRNSQIIVYENGKLADVFCVNKKGKMKFTLHEGNYYKVKVEKEGFITKIIDINTCIPGWYKGAYFYNFTVDMVPLPDNENYPEGVHVGEVEFNIENAVFENDWELTNRVNSLIRKENRTAYTQPKNDLNTF